MVTMDLLCSFGEIVYFFDESSIHAWQTIRKCWMNPEMTFNVPIRKKGDYCTMYGAIGGTIGTPVALVFELHTTTNKENTVTFFKKLRK